MKRSIAKTTALTPKSFFKKKKIWISTHFSLCYDNLFPQMLVDIVLFNILLTFRYDLD